MGIVSIVLGIVIVFLLRKKKINSYEYIAFSLLLLLLLITYMNFDHLLVIILFLVALVGVYFTNKKRAMLLSLMYVVAMLLLLLGLITEKTAMYKDANTYINKDIINQVIPIDLQEKYIQYIAIAGYSTDDVEKYITTISENLQKELDDLSIFEAYETYRSTKIYLAQRQEYYHSNEETLVTKIDQEIMYYNTLNHAAQTEYKKEIKKIVEEVIQ